MKSAKDEITDLEDELEIEGGPLLTPSPKDQRVLTLLFSIRTLAVDGQKKIEEIRRNQEQSDEKVDKLGEKVDSVYEKLLEPDKGLFARVRDLEIKSVNNSEKEKELKAAVKHVDQLVDWKSAFGKVWWWLGFTLVGIILKYIFDVLFTKK